MVEIIVWIILYFFLSGAVLVVHYWYNLFQSREQYTRDEILDFMRIIQDQIQKLTASGDRGLNFISIFVGVVTAWILTLFGGLVSPNSSLAPDHAEAEMPNYFFQSALFLLILHLVWPSLKEMALERGGESSPIYKILQTEIPFFYGFCSALGAVNLAVWGVYHEMLFLFCFINMLICLFYVGYRLQSVEELQGPT